MTTIAREQLIERAQARLELMQAASREFHESPSLQMDLELARIALASLDAEPVAYMFKDGDDIEYNGHNEFSGGGKGVPLYTAPPAPVVPDEREAFNVWNNDTDCPLAGLTVKQAAWLAWLKRSGTIKSFEPATDEFEVWARSEGLIHDSYGLRTVNTSADVARKAWNACRAAMLQDGNSPAIPDGWIPVNERMPDKLIPVMVMYEDGEMWSAMWNGNRWDDGTEYPDPHAVTHWREMPAAPQQEE